jgi:hypothetical protein
MAHVHEQGDLLGGEADQMLIAVVDDPHGASCVAVPVYSLRPPTWGGDDPNVAGKADAAAPPGGVAAVGVGRWWR